MAKKKSDKKEKKAAKKTVVKKADKKKTAPKKKEKKAAKPAPTGKTVARISTSTSGTGDKSTNYVAREAIQKVRACKSVEEVKAFTRGEKRLTVKRIIPGVINRLSE